MYTLGIEQGTWAGVDVEKRPRYLPSRSGLNTVALQRSKLRHSAYYKIRRNVL